MAKSKKVSKMKKGAKSVKKTEKKVKKEQKKSTRKSGGAKKSKVRVIFMSVGSYPRIGDTENEQRFRRAWAKRERNEITEEEFKQIEREFTKLAIEEQEKAGIDIITDGAIGWYDQISHFARNVQGVKINGLLRFFDTNTYFRQPIVDEQTPDNPEVKPVLQDEFSYAKSVAKKVVKPFLTGPITLARLTKGDFKKAVEIYTKLIENEVRILSENGAQIIQIDEPALTKDDIGGKEFDALPYLERIYDAKKPETKLMYYFYFRDFSKDYKAFQKIPADILGFDMTYSRIEDVISRDGTKKELFLGIVDGRNTYIEKPKDVLQRLNKVLRNYPFENIYVGPSSGLEYLPRKFAFLKLKNLTNMLKHLKK